MSKVIGNWKRITVEIINGQEVRQSGETDLTIREAFTPEAHTGEILTAMVNTFDQSGVELDLAAQQKLSWLLATLSDFLSDIGEETANVEYTIRTARIPQPEVSP